jgi:predicted PurR-regulated permease PerM
MRREKDVSMERFFQSRIFTILVYAILIMTALFMLFKMTPMIEGLYRFVKAVLGPFVVAMIISYVLNPIVNLLNARKVPRTMAVLLIYMVFIVSVTVILMNVIPMFIRQLKELNEHLPELGMKMQMFMHNVYQNELVPPGVREGLNRSLAGLEQEIGRRITAFVNDIGSTINAIFIAFIIPFLVFYMLKDFKMIERTTLTFVPKKHRLETIRMLIDIDQALGNYVRGQFIVCLIVGVLTYLGYLLIGMPYALLLASIVAVFNIIPYLGPFFGAAPALILAATISWKMLLMVAVVNLVVQTLEGNVISPQVVGRSLNLHPLLIIFILLVGGELAGIAGLILAVPVFAVLKVIYSHVSLHIKRRRNV